MKDSPVEISRKEGPCGNGDWSGYSAVYSKIQKGCQAMSQSKLHNIGKDHVESMADLESGHEERMKWRVHWMITYGWI